MKLGAAGDYGWPWKGLGVAVEGHGGDGVATQWLKAADLAVRWRNTHERVRERWRAMWLGWAWRWLGEDVGEGEGS